MTEHEKWLAIREGHFNAAVEEYFRHRPDAESPSNSRVFYAGHCCGYEATTKLEAELAALAEQCPKGQLLVPIGLLTEIRRAFEAEGEGRGHQHWDKTGQHGAGCPKCIAQCTAADLTRRALWNINNLLGPSSGEEGK